MWIIPLVSRDYSPWLSHLRLCMQAGREEEGASEPIMWGVHIQPCGTGTAQLPARSRVSFGESQPTLLHVPCVHSTAWHSWGAAASRCGPRQQELPALLCQQERAGSKCQRELLSLRPAWGGETLEDGHSRAAARRDPSDSQHFSPRLICKPVPSSAEVLLREQPHALCWGQRGRGSTDRSARAKSVHEWVPGSGGRNTEQNMERGRAAPKEKQQWAPHKHMLGIPDAGDTATEKFLFVKTKGSDLSADAYCLVPAASMALR